MKETEGWLRVKKYTDEGKPTCWGDNLHKCDLYWRLGGVKGCGYIHNGSPDPTCPVWHGESKSEWQPISTAPTDGSYFIVKAAHRAGDNVIHIVGRFEEDGFYCEDRSELSFNYNPILWAPLPQEK